MELLMLLSLMLSTWRISSLLVKEHGPFNMFDRLRQFVGVRYTENMIPYGDHVLGEIFVCVWCMSIYVGLSLAVCHYFFPAILFWVTLPLSFSAAAIIIEEKFINGS